MVICMREKVIVKAFSDKTVLSCKELFLNDYYDADLPEIDDSDYISGHKIDRVEQHFYSDTGCIIRIIYYDAEGSPYRSYEIKDGVCTTEEL